MSNAALLSLLRNTIKMMATRGYNVDYFAPLTQRNPSKEDQEEGDYTVGIDYFENTYYNFIKKNQPYPIYQQLIEMGKTSLRCLSSFQFVKGPEENPTDRCLVYFGDVCSSSKQVPSSELCIFAKLLLGGDGLPASSSGIMITCNKLASQTATRLSEFQMANIKCDEEIKDGGAIFTQHFLDEELQYDPTTSIWTSAMRILTDEEGKALLKESKLTLGQLPRISIDEPCAKYRGVRPGKIVHLDRYNFLPDMLCDEEIFYRLAYKKPHEKKKSSKPPARAHR